MSFVIMGLSSVPGCEVKAAHWEIKSRHYSSSDGGQTVMGFRVEPLFVCGIWTVC